MYTMSGFDPSLIILVNIYADLYGDRQQTSVYNNGVMQVSVFVSVNYTGEASEDDIKRYVQDNVVIYSLNYGENVQWQKSTSDNGFHHDIDHAANKNPAVPPKMISDVRTPLYFTVPGGRAEGEHRWIAKLDGKQTNDSTPLFVKVKSFSVNKDHFEISDRASLSCAHLRVLKYKYDVFPDTQKLVKSINYKGIKFTGTGGNTWLSMAMSSKGNKLGAFIEYKETSNINIATAYRKYEQSEVERRDLGICSYKVMIRSQCLDDTLDIDSADVEGVWNEGIAMVSVHDKSIDFTCEDQDDTVLNNFNNHDFEMNDFVLQDTFGGMVEVNINWDKGDWWGIWAISSAEVIYL
uniref:Uncharacterized protein n=1 Tax=Amphimedon queenslandica TaxID=400682 RepID=A0A1X7VCA0_AMPQE